MILFKKARDLIQHLKKAGKKTSKIGFVPTMGALHKGHLSLIHASKQNNGLTVCSIFINPRQFNDTKDFEKYPVTLENDILLLEQYGTDILFLPSVHEIYPDSIHEHRHYELGYLENILEGKYRPGHFQGVCDVMHRLLDIVSPDNLYMGEKDYQQCLVVKKLLSISGSSAAFNKVPTVREADGLAMSSRNLRLNADERINATGIFEALSLIRDNAHRLSFETVKNKAAALLQAKGFRIDYVEMADAETLLPVAEAGNDKRTIALVAAFMNEVRLIDNMIISG